MDITDIHRHFRGDNHSSDSNDERDCDEGGSLKSAVLDPAMNYDLISKFPEFVFSAGIHPWLTVDSTAISETELNRLAAAATLPQVVAIGECGIDLLKGGAMFRQLQLFKRHLELSETLGKPMIIHAVKADDIILGLHRDLRPTQKWAIHGFRGKPGAARMLLAAGCYLSFGEKFNVETLKMTPTDRILTETDESEKPIGEIITLLSEARGENLREQIATNTLTFLNLD